MVGMTKSNIEKFYYSNQDIVRATIKFILYRHGKLTVKEIQEKIGLKRQTTYNYLKKLVEDEILEVEYEPKEGKPQWNITYYKIRIEDFLGESKNLSYTEKIKRKDKDWVERKKTIIDVLNMNLAALIEARSSIQNMNIKDFEEYIKMQPEVWGVFTSLFLLTDEEYSKLQTKFKKLMNEFLASENSKTNGEKANNIFLFSFLRDFSL